MLGAPVLEGWAIVDNTTGEDWSNVRLALVSGRPISFVSRLYEPRYVDRPTAELPEEAPIGQLVHEGTIEDRRAVAKGFRGTVGGALPLAAPAPAEQELAEGREMLPTSIAAPAMAREAGELFEYRIPALVTVRSNESAMLPFAQEKVDARKLLIYAGHAALHPRHASMSFRIPRVRRWTADR